MKKYLSMFVIPLIVLSATSAQSAHHKGPDDSAARFRAQQSVIPFNDPGVAVGLVRNPGDCEPGSAEPSWGGRGGLLGYTCTNSAN